MKKSHRQSINLITLALTLLVAALLVGGTGLWQVDPVGPASPASYIVQADSVETAKALVESVGGVVTHELGIIRAAGADLSATQLTALEVLQAVDRIYPNNTARISAKPGSDPAPVPVVETVRDDFNIINYNNNDGTQPWLGPWQESQDDGTAGDGTVRIVGMELQLHNRDGGSLESIERTVDLSLATTATLSLSYSGFGEGGLDIVAVEASDDGGTNFAVLDQIEIVGYPSAARAYLLSRRSH